MKPGPQKNQRNERIRVGDVVCPNYEDAESAKYFNAKDRRIPPNAELVVTAVVDDNLIHFSYKGETSNLYNCFSRRVFKIDKRKHKNILDDNLFEL